ncbi:MAG: hypothetical protein IOD12_09205 [Silvanigrellales bacterium]|nr:hypothetical protein [Silvanigrellales bacterium]
MAKASQEPNWLYGKDRKNHVLAQVSETTFFQLNADKVVDGMKAQSLKRSTRVAHFLAEGPYKNNPSANIAGGNPGRLDPFSTAIALLSDPNVVKKSVVSEKPSMVDIMSVWNQSKRATAQWDGGIRVEMMRNLGAELGVIGDPEEVSLKNAELSTELLRDLPPPAYPFKISESLRSRGEVLFKENCAGCHYDNNETVYPVSVVGTDPNRASLITDSGRTALIKALRQACGKSEACKGIEDKDIIRPTGQSVGYVAHPLDGIWARAPYLHNGSVPTLMHLLVPRLRQEENAREFWRGNISYDQDWVGFEWRNSQAPQGFSENQSSSNKAFVDEKGNFLAARLYKVGDESLGTSNRGHESGIFLKRSWSEDFSTPEGQDTRALLEYLKTL